MRTWNELVLFILDNPSFYIVLMISPGTIGPDIYTGSDKNETLEKRNIRQPFDIFDERLKKEPFIINDKEVFGAMKFILRDNQ